MTEINMVDSITQKTNFFLFASIQLNNSVIDSNENLEASDVLYSFPALWYHSGLKFNHQISFRMSGCAC